MTIKWQFKVGDRVRNITAIISDRDLGSLGTVITLLDGSIFDLIQVEFDTTPPDSRSGHREWTMSDNELVPAWVVA